MPFDLNAWKQKAGEGAVLLQAWVARQARAAARPASGLVYAGLCGAALWPVVAAVQRGEMTGVAGAALGVAAGVGGNLLAEQVQRWRDAATAEQVAARVAEAAPLDPALRDALDGVLEQMGTIPQVQAGLTADARAWLDGQLRQDLTTLGNLPRFEGVLVAGDVHGDVVTGTKNVMFDFGGQTVRGPQTIVTGDYIDQRHSGPTYNTHIERAEGIAIGNGARVGRDPAVPPAEGGDSSLTSTAALRKGLARLDDVRLDALCLDHFPEVYDTFGRGMRRDEKVNLLLDYCRRRSEEAARLAGLLAV